MTTSVNWSLKNKTWYSSTGQAINELPGFFSDRIQEKQKLTADIAENKDKIPPKRIIVIGAGDRSTRYSQTLKNFPENISFHAVVDPDSSKRKFFGDQFGIGQNRRFENLKEALESFTPKDKPDGAIIGTPDETHKDIALKVMETGLSFLLEKPIGTTVEDCQAIVKTYEEVNEKRVRQGLQPLTGTACHVLQYTLYSQIIEEILLSGILGHVDKIVHTEPIGGESHYISSYIRNPAWKDGEMEYMKMIHDWVQAIDWARFAKAGRCKRVNSVAQETFYTPAHLPPDAVTPSGAKPEKCEECAISGTCRCSARRMYVEGAAKKFSDGTYGFQHHPVRKLVDQGKAKSLLEKAESVEEGLQRVAEEVQKTTRETSWGDCVFKPGQHKTHGNQTTMLSFEGLQITVEMIAHTSEVCMRRTNFHGSEGELKIDMSKKNAIINFFDLDKKGFTIDMAAIANTSLDRGHGGGDEGVAIAFMNALLEPYRGKVTPITECMEAHLIADAAIKSRSNYGSPVFLEDGTSDIEDLVPAKKRRV